MNKTQPQPISPSRHMQAIIEAISSNEGVILRSWIDAQRRSLASREALLEPDELLTQSRAFFASFLQALRIGSLDECHGEPWAPVRHVLDGLSRKRAEQGLTPSETAATVFALKETLGEMLQPHFVNDLATFFVQFSCLSRLLDRLGLYTTESFIKSREETIRQQSRDLLEISCPCIRLWEGVLAVPIIGVLDSRRSQQVMETLLTMVVETRSRVVILDITGVPTVDTLTAAHLIKTVQAVKLLGAHAVITGISGRIAQTVIGLGLDLRGIRTKALMADGVAEAFERLGVTVVAKSRTAARPGDTA